MGRSQSTGARAVRLAAAALSALCAGLVPIGAARATGPADTLTNETITVGGIPRSYLLFVPGRYDAAGSVHAAAVVFHGFSGSSRDLVPTVVPAASRAGLVVAFPQGLGSSATYPTGASFDAGQCCSAAKWTNVDDVGLAVQLIGVLKARFRPRRVVTAGFSNGGMLAFLVACTHADLVDGVVDNSGSEALPAAECDPSRPLRVVAIHGTADPAVPFDGGFTAESAVVADPWGFRAITGVVDEWGQGHDGCSRRTVTRRSGYALTTWSRCRGESSAQLFAVTGMGHIPAAYPGPVDLGAQIARTAGP